MHLDPSAHFGPAPSAPADAPFLTHVLADMPLGQVHGLLLGAVGPRPIALVSTLDEEGRANLAPFSYYNVFSTRPAIVVVGPNRSGRTGLHKHTYHNAKATGELVIHAVTGAIVQATNLASTEYPAGVNEFEKAGFTPLPSVHVRPPRVAESPIHLECRLRDIWEAGEGPGAGSLLIAEVVCQHIRADVLGADGRIDQTRIGLVGRMGGEYYSHAAGAALFTVPRPGAASLGMDGLPEPIRTSPVLTGEQLALLALADAPPSPAHVAAYAATHATDLALLPTADARHRRAQRLVREGNATEAWLVLLAPLP